MMKWKWYFFITILSRKWCFGELSPLVCTSSSDIKNCIYENEDRISKMVKKSNELRRLADMLTSEMHEKSEMIRQFNSSLFQFQTKESHNKDIQNIQIHIADLKTADEDLTNRMQYQLQTETEKLDKLAELISTLEAENEHFTRSLLEYAKSFNLKIMMAEKKCKSAVDDVDRKMSHLTELVESEGQLFEEQFTNSDSIVEALQEKLVTLEEEINEEKILRTTDNQKLLEDTKNTVDTAIDDMIKLDTKSTKNQAEIHALKGRMDEIETKSKELAKSAAAAFEEPRRVVEQLPNDQNAYDTLKSRIDKIAYELAHVKTQMNRDKTKMIKNMSQLTTWIRDVLGGIRGELDNQDELIANLTTSVAQKDEIIENLEKDIVTSMADSDELRTKLFKSDLDRDLRLARLELAIKGSEGKTTLKDKIIELEKWKETTSAILTDLQLAKNKDP